MQNYNFNTSAGYKIIIKAESEEKAKEIYNNLLNNKL